MPPACYITCTSDANEAKSWAKIWKIGTGAMKYTVGICQAGVWIGDGYGQLYKQSWNATEVRREADQVDKIGLKIG